MKKTTVGLQLKHPASFNYLKAEPAVAQEVQAVAVTRCRKKLNNLPFARLPIIWKALSGLGLIKKAAQFWAAFLLRDLF
jgi:hypothetical protein